MTWSVVFRRWALAALLVNHGAQIVMRLLHYSGTLP